MKSSLSSMGILVAAMVITANLAFARAFDGIYRAESNCTFTTNFDHEGDKTIFILLDTKIVVHENVPMPFWGWVPLYPAIIFQTDQDFSPILALGIGMVQQSFIYNSPNNYSWGTYSENGATFQQEGGASFDPVTGRNENFDTIKLERIADGLRLTSLNRTTSRDAGPVVCSFTFERPLGGDDELP